MSVLKIWYLHILGFRYRKCTLRIPTSCRNGTVTLQGAWCDSSPTAANRCPFTQTLPLTFVVVAVARLVVAVVVVAVAAAALVAVAVAVAVAGAVAGNVVVVAMLVAVAWQ